ncbi:hypothetical protein WCT87_07985 [Pectobacterium brasiliense]|uniref:hypothetical protein n=1 Tax=Pectobacterium brasiliense TaxID=180957 RepID=UPI0030196B39
MTDLLSKERLEQLGGSLQASAKYTAGVDAIAFSDAAKAIGELLQRREAAEKPTCYLRNDSYGGFVECGQFDDRGSPVFSAPPLPVVPDEATPNNIQALSGCVTSRNGGWHSMDEGQRDIAVDVWNACRDAMLQLSGNSEQVIDYKSIVERISEIVHGKVTDVDLLAITVKSMLDRLKSNYPVIPEGWALVPIEPTEAMLILLGMTGSFDSMIAQYQKALAAAPQPSEPS